MFDLSPGIQLLRDKITAAIYLSLAIALAVAAWYHHLLGHYDQILWPALTSPFMLALAFIRFIQAPDSTNLTPYPVLLLLGAVLINNGNLEDSLYRQWLYMFPVLTFFVLPVRKATIALSVFIITFFILRSDLYNAQIFSDLTIHSTLFAGISFLFAYTQEKQTRTLEELSGKDSLTSAFTESQLHERLNVEVARAETTHRPLSALQISLHRLDEFIDQHGETACNRVIRKISHTMQGSCRTGDELYRIHEHTFLYLLPNTSENGSIVLKERVWQKLAEQADLDNILSEITIQSATLNDGEDPAHFLSRTLSVQQKPL